MKQIKTILTKAAALLLLCGTVVTLSGCQLVYVKYHTTPDSETAVAATEETRDLSQLPVSDPVDGKSAKDITINYAELSSAIAKLQPSDLSETAFMIMVAKEASNTFLPDETDPFILQYSKRCDCVSDYYNTSLLISTLTADEISAALKKSVKSGDALDYVSDILEIPALDASSLVTKGYLLSLRTLPFYSVNKSGVNGIGVYNTNQTYFDCSAATDSFADIECLFINEDVLGSELSASIITTALETDFTFDKFFEAMKSTEKSVEYDIALSSDKTQLGQIAFVRSGLRYTEISGTYPQISASLSNTDELDKLIAELCATNLYVKPAATEAPEDSSAVVIADPSGSDVFASGKAAFYIGTVSDISRLSSEKIAWSVLPLPKAAENVYNIEKNHSVLCVPATNTRLETTGLVLNAFASLPTDWMWQEFAVNALQNHLPSASSYYSLCKVFDNRTFCDFAIIYGSGVKNLAAATYEAVNKCATDGNSVSKTVSSYSKAVNTAIKKLK